jgi:hypothetical protein
LERKALDSWGISVSGETPQELATRRLGERPPESKRLERKSTFFHIKNNKRHLESLQSIPYVDNLKPPIKKVVFYVV